MMPQKRNPDVFEIARGSASRASGDLIALLGALKGLPSGYNKDLQDDKRALFDAVDMIALVLAAVSGAVAELTFDASRMLCAISPALMATDLADYLVVRGASFRDAHAAVGSLVRESEAATCELNSLPFSSYQRAHPLFAEDVTDWLSAERSVSRREIEGGTGPAAVAEQLLKAKALLSAEVS